MAANTWQLPEVQQHQQVQALEQERRAKRGRDGPGMNRQTVPQPHSVGGV
jgi:hypothetical protein